MPHDLKLFSLDHNRKKKIFLKLLTKNENNDEKYCTCQLPLVPLTNNSESVFHLSPHPFGGAKEEKFFLFRLKELHWNLITTTLCHKWPIVDGCLLMMVITNATDRQKWQKVIEINIKKESEAKKCLVEWSGRKVSCTVLIKGFKWFTFFYTTRHLHLSLLSWDLFRN